MSSIFPGPNGILKNEVVAVNNANSLRATQSTIYDDTDISSYSLVSGASIDAAFANDEWVTVLERTSSTNSALVFTALVSFYHATAGVAGSSLSIRVYVDDVLRMERSLTMNDATTQAVYSTTSIVQSDVALVAKSVRIQIKRHNSLGAGTGHSISASITKLRSASL